MATGVNPVFLLTRDIPGVTSDRPVTVLEVCVAAERVAGQGSVVGAQNIGGLWRVYPATREARSVLLVQGLRLRGSVQQVKNTNPYILRDDSGEEKPSTKVWVDNVPISVADSEIEHSLLKAGCELRSKIKNERARDSDNKLTRFLTGRRFVFITVPKVPLEKTLQVSVFTAKIYHREQKQMKKTIVCSNCLEQNHHASQCEKEIVCRVCKQPGHKQGDPACDFTFVSGHQRKARNGGNVEREKNDCVQLTDDTHKSESEKDEREKDGSEMQTDDSQKAEDDRQTAAKGKETRGRPSSRQSTLSSTLELRTSTRHRSETPKRGRSSESSPGTVGNQAKRDKAKQNKDSPPTT